MIAEAPLPEQPGAIAAPFARAVGIRDAADEVLRARRRVGHRGFGGRAARREVLEDVPVLVGVEVAESGKPAGDAGGAFSYVCVGIGLKQLLLPVRSNATLPGSDRWP